MVGRPAIEIGFVILIGCGRVYFDPTHRRDDAAFAVDDAPTDVDDGPIVDMALPPDASSLILGCADLSREALVDPVMFPDVAGCSASWQGKLSMRAASAGAGCGNDLGTCTAPRDACAVGWHICGEAPVVEMMSIGASACLAAGVGAWVAAASHCVTICTYVNTSTTSYPCAPNGNCSEPICCGTGCIGAADGVACVDGLFPGTTETAGGPNDGCGDISIAGGIHVDGVLCCRG